HLREALDDEVEEVAPLELLDLVLEAEVFEDLAGLRGETLDVVDEIRPDLGGVGKEPLEIELRGVVEALLGDPPQHAVSYLGRLPRELGGAGEDCILGG